MLFLLPLHPGVKPIVPKIFNKCSNYIQVPRHAMSASLPYCEYNYPNLVGRARGRTFITSSQLMIDEPKKASAPSALDPTLRRGTITGHRHHHRTNSEPSLQTAAEIVTRVRIKRIRFYRNSQDDIYPSPCTSSEFLSEYYCNALHCISTESYLTKFTAFVSAPFSNAEREKGLR